MKFYLILALSVALLSSCDTTTSTSPPAYVGLTHAAFKLDVSDQGTLHNEIALAYANRRDELGDRPITRKEFVRLMVAAANEAFAKEGYPAVVTAPDINRVIDEIHNLRRRNVFNFFSYDTGEPRAIVDDWEKRGIVSHADADAVRKELEGTSSNRDSKQLQAFRSVYGASMSLWTDPTFSKRFGLVDRRLQMLDDGVPDKSMWGWEMDSIGVLLGWFLGGPLGGTVGGICFSWAYYEIPAAPGDSWDCSDYCNMA